MKNPTFDSLCRAARNLPVNHEVVQILSGAEINANDTCFAEKAAPESQWAEIALGSIGMLFHSQTKPTTLQWFQRRGYRW